MTTEEYVPDRGHLIWLNFSPQAGREQAGRRPALVLSSASYNGKTGRALVCPITSKIKGYPFEVVLPPGQIHGSVLADHVKNSDWRARQAQFVTTAPSTVISEVQEKVQALLTT